MPIVATTDRDIFTLRFGLYFGSIFLVIGLYLAFFPVWLQWRGLSANEIATVISLSTFVRVFAAPLSAFAADRAGNRQLFLTVLSWSALGGIVVMTSMSSFLTILAVNTLIGLCWTPILPLTDAVAMSGVKQFGVDYGRMRLWGSLSFIAVTTSGGLLLEFTGPANIIWLNVGAASIVALLSLRLPRVADEAHDDPLPKAQVTLADIRNLLRSRAFVVFLLAAGLAQGTHGVYYVFASVHWKSQGMGTDTIGLLWAIGVAAEVMLFAFSARLVARTGPARLIIIASIAAVLRWSITAMDPPLVLLAAVQTLHALTFGAAHLGAMHFIFRAVPERYSATAQAIYAAFAAGIVLGSMMYISGPLYGRFGGGAYWTSAATGVLAAGFAYWLHRHWRDESLGDRSTSPQKN